MYYDDLLLLLLKSVTIQALIGCAAMGWLCCIPVRVILFTFCVTVDFVTTSDAASGVAISTAVNSV